MSRTANAIGFSDEQAMLLDSARDFCRQRSPTSKVRELLGDPQGYDLGVWEEMLQLGWMGIAVEEKFGGSALGIGSVAPVAEATGRALLSTPLIDSTLAAQAISRAGDAAQQEAWLPRLANGAVGSLALLDGEDWGDADSRCTISGDGGKLSLHGEKWYVPYAHTAELLVVSVQFAGQPALALVSNDSLAANAVRPQRLIDETKRAARVVFDGVEITQGSLITGAGVAPALRDLKLLGALLSAAEAAGSAAACLDLVVEYLKTRRQFGRLIGSYQALKHPTVDILLAMDAARSHVYHAATLVSATALDDAAECACRMAKVQATEALCLAGDRAVQFHGAMGFTYECDAQLYLRRAQWAQQQFGDAAHHRKRLGALLLD